MQDRTSGRPHSASPSTETTPKVRWTITWVCFKKLGPQLTSRLVLAGCCPPPCTCLAWGTQAPLPSTVPGTGYHILGEGDSYDVLCDFACTHNYSLQRLVHLAPLQVMEVLYTCRYLSGTLPLTHLAATGTVYAYWSFHLLLSQVLKQSIGQHSQLRCWFPLLG